MTIYGVDVPFAEHCGIEDAGFAPDGATRIRLAMRPAFANHLGIAHGGLVATLLDVCMGSAERLHCGRSVMTLDMQASFLSPGTGILIGEGRVTKGGRTILFCEATVAREEDGEIVAKATGLFKPAREPDAQTSV